MIQSVHRPKACRGSASQHRSVYTPGMQWLGRKSNLFFSCTCHIFDTKSVQEFTFLDHPRPRDAQAEKELVSSTAEEACAPQEVHLLQSGCTARKIRSQQPPDTQVQPALIKKLNLILIHANSPSIHKHAPFTHMHTLFTFIRALLTHVNAQYTHTQSLSTHTHTLFSHRHALYIHI